MTRGDAHGRQRSALRLLVVAAALVIYVVDPSEHPGRRPFGLAVLLSFLVYSAVLYALRRTRPLPAALAPWLDVAWVTVLVAVSEATSSVFFPLYLLPILYASFGGGFRPGMAVVVASALSFAVVGALTAPRDPGVDPARYLVRSLYLLVLGYVTAVWGGHEVRSRARLALLREVTALSNPRFGVERTVGRLLEALRAFFDADACLLAVAEEDGRGGWMRTATRGTPAADRRELPPELARAVLAGPAAAAVLVHAPRLPGERAVTVQHLLEGAASPSPGDTASGAALAELLEAGALVSTPFRWHASATGRLLLVRRRPAPFEADDVDFLRQVVAQVAPVLDSVRLVDRLASDAAEEERLRIARDLHDSVIQPYLGLRLGLAAAQSALSAGRLEDGKRDVARLVELADGELQTLRGYVRGLRAAGGSPSAGLLASGIRRFCERFAAATGIRVDVATAGPPVESDRLAAEAFQMVAEALSNVRRHSSAERVEVRLDSAGDRLRLSVANDGAGPDDPPFSPRSLRERAAALGGDVRVEGPAGGRTTVHVEIPL